MGYLPYPDYFKTDWWFNLKWKHIYGKASAKCYICTSSGKLLIHHVSYNNLFHEKLIRDIYILCFDCHNKAHFWTIFKIKVPLTKNWLLFSMRLRKSIFYLQSSQFGLFLLWFTFILLIGMVNIAKSIFRKSIIFFFGLIWVVLKILLNRTGIKVIS